MYLWWICAAQAVVLLCSFNLYRLVKNRECEIAALKAENALLREWKDSVSKGQMTTQVTHG